MLDWKIYYGDGSTFSSDDGPPEAAPARNVQALAYVHDLVGKVVLKGPDWYIYCGGEWFGTDEFGLLDQLIEMGLLRRSGSPVKFEILLDGSWKPTERPNIWFDIVSLGPAKAGRWLPREKFHAIYRRALEDPDMPRMSAFMPLNNYSQTDAEKEAIDNPVAPYAGKDDR